MSAAVGRWGLQQANLPSYRPFGRRRCRHSQALASAWNGLIERLWKHLKCSRMANVLFSGFKQFTEHLSEALNDFASHPDFTLSVAPQPPRKTIRKNSSQVPKSQNLFN
jgi:hypothetical protein